MYAHITLLFFKKSVSDLIPLHFRHPKTSTSASIRSYSDKENRLGFGRGSVHSDPIRFHLMCKIYTLTTER
jgi:hypothetical protein